MLKARVVHATACGTPTAFFDLAGVPHHNAATMYYGIHRVPQIIYICIYIYIYKHNLSLIVVAHEVVISASGQGNETLQARRICCSWIDLIYYSLLCSSM